MSPPTQTLAFFGATGGVTNTTLAKTLNAGYHSTALARTPQRLIDMLRTAHSVPLEIIEKYLTIHTGDVKDISAVSAALKNPLDQSKLVDTIIFGIGGYPVMQRSLLQPITLNDVHICEDAISTIFRALEALEIQGVTQSKTGRKPLFSTISTTGISDKGRDVPLLLYPLYIYVLHVPHEDKRKAEQLLINDDGKHIRDCVVVRPTLLTDVAASGVEKLRVGWEWKGAETEKAGIKDKGPELGWTVGRKDVGGWVFEKVVREGGWEGRCVSLAY
ncbi:uncharacterized protein M421DRAFT_425986 [Didymella exigua CBS 183.55]|uniref:Uncharacterized protein n=1 Tax=Didymella exigua CBS 183.55 TaxID=1150837 RepID=A0A6A5R6U5_9PLEO|nr:uncharacterized protein M421DRAFT_425986 [Didymella exigua CBS 183.55]KAF1923323.1 hypothetical protein M421DRAFT_425986 [Didymella exigua CBS 183.55]